ncbi:MAG: transposase [Pseudomonadota bacterium]
MVSRLEVVETGRRRRWTDAEKLRIVAESMAGSRLVSATARRHGISRWQLNTWRRQVREGLLIGDEPMGVTPAFSAVTLAPDAETAAPAQPALPDRVPLPDPERIEIVLTNGRRLLVGGGIDVGSLARLVAVLERA